MGDEPEKIETSPDQRLESVFSAWKNAWINPKNGPAFGGRRDAHSIGITDSPDLQRERSAYEQVVKVIVDTLIEAEKTGNAPLALRKILDVIDEKLSGTGF